MFKPVYYLYLLFLSLFIYSCASIGTPEGGPKDETPPTLLDSNPKNRSLNVSTQKLEFIFDEEIQVKDLNRQLLITPYTNNTYKSSVSKEKVTLEFEKPLEPNTTYFINFRGAVSDLTEGNKPENLSLTFSTGTYLDSGQVSGNVRDLFSNAPEKGINVTLYPAHDTTTIRKHKPYYLTQTDEKGHFQLQNVRLGEYRIYAHQDKNNNLLYDNENEKIAYQKDFVTITPQTDSVLLTTLKVDTRRPAVERSEKFTDEYRLTFNEGLTNISVATLDAPAAAPAPMLPLIDNTGKGIRFFPTSTLAKADYVLTAIDSAKNTLIDTLNISLEGKKAARGQEVFKPKTYSGAIAKDEPLQLVFNIPIKITQPNALTLLQDTINRKELSYPQDFKLDPTNTIITVNELLTAKENVQVLLDTTKILPVSGDPFPRQNNKYPILSSTAVGNLLSKVTTQYKRYWIEILDANRQIVKVLDSPKEIKLDKLEPNKYTIRVKIDEDNDGVWRAGNADLSTPAERIYHYPQTIEIRANWEIEIAPPMPPLAF